MDDYFSTSRDNDSTVCDEYDTYPYVIVSVVHSVSAMVSALCCIFVIILIFLLKKHHFFIQRLIIYSCLATLIRSVSLILLLHRLGNNNSRVVENLCIVSAFLNQWSLWTITLNFLLITFVLLITGVFHKNVAHLEGLYVVLIFIFPLTFNWIPFINNTYGRNEAVCWIRDVNYDNCTEHNFGSILQTVLWTIPAYLLLALFITTYVLVTVFVARQKYCNRWKAKITTDPETRILKKRLNEEVWPLLLLPTGLLLLNIFPIANQVYNTINPNDPSLALWMLQAVFSPLIGGYIALIYLLDRDTIKRLKYSNLKAAITQRDVVREYPIQVGRISDSAPRRELSLSTPYSHYACAENPGVALRDQSFLTTHSD